MSATAAFPGLPAQAEYDAAKAAWEEDKKKAKKGTPLKERVSDVHSEELPQRSCSSVQHAVHAPYRGVAGGRHVLLLSCHMLSPQL